MLDICCMVVRGPQHLIRACIRRKHKRNPPWGRGKNFRAGASGYTGLTVLAVNTCAFCLYVESTKPPELQALPKRHRARTQPDLDTPCHHACGTCLQSSFCTPTTIPSSPCASYIPIFLCSQELTTWSPSSPPQVIHF